MVTRQAVPLWGVWFDDALNDFPVTIIRGDRTVGGLAVTDDCRWDGQADDYTGPTFREDES